MVAVAFLAATLTAGQLYISTDTRNRQLRAYASVREVALNIKVQLDQPAELPMVLTNFGTTPALEVEVGSTIVFLEYPLKRDDYKLTRRPNGVNSKNTVFPGATYTYSATSERKFTQSDLKRLQDPKVRLYVLSEATYLDVFGERHRTRFCAFYEPSDPKAVVCDRFNTAD